MQRYFISDSDFNNNKITSNDVFHITRVMRGKIGDKIEVCNSGKAYLAELTKFNENEVFFNIVEELHQESKKTRFTLIQGLPKGDKLDDIIMHSTELGVDSIILVDMIRSIAKIEDKKLANRLERFNKIAKEAAEQSHRLSIPDVTYEKKLDKIDFSKYDLVMLLDEEEAKKLKPVYLNDISLKNLNNICFIVGPEGGIDNKEREMLLGKGAKMIALTKNILRTETASLSILAELDYKLREE